LFILLVIRLLFLLLLLVTSTILLPRLPLLLALLAIPTTCIICSLLITSSSPPTNLSLRLLLSLRKKMSCSQAFDHLLPFIFIERYLFSKHLFSLIEEAHHFLCRLHILLDQFGVLTQVCFIALNLLDGGRVIFDCVAHPKSI